MSLWNNLTDNAKDSCYRERMDKMYQGTWFFLKLQFCEMQALKFCVLLTGRLHFINIWRLQFLMDLFENVDRQCKRTMLVRKSSQNVLKNQLCLTIASLLALVG